MNSNCGAKSNYEHGDNLHVIKINSPNNKIVEISTFPIHLMFMHHDYVVKFVTHRPLHVISCIVVVVVQVHDFMNQK
jgi:hypothetical protein